MGSRNLVDFGTTWYYLYGIAGYSFCLATSAWRRRKLKKQSQAKFGPGKLRNNFEFFWDVDFFVRRDNAQKFS